MALRSQPDPNSVSIVNYILLPGSIATGDELALINTSGTNFKAGDKWLHVLHMNNTNVDGWLPIIRNGFAIGTLIDNGVVTPSDSIKKIISNTITYETDNGSIVTKELFPV